MFKMYSQESAIKLMFVIHMRGVNSLHKKGWLNGTICKGYENGVSAVLSFEGHMLSHLEEELEFSLAFFALDYKSKRDYSDKSYFALVQLQLYKLKAFKIPV